MKFAMIPINRRYDENGNRIVRRILISYNKKTLKGKYVSTKLIEVDPYFKNPNSSQKYDFYDTYFIHIDDRYHDEYQKHLMNVKRYYMYNEGLLCDNAIEFTANNTTEAIEIFNNREEKR